MERVTNKTTSEIELTNISSDVEVNGKSETHNKKNLGWLAAKISNIRQVITVEPYLLLYIIPLMIVSITVQQFNLEKACLADLNYSRVLCDEIIYGISNNTDAEEIAIQTIVVRISNWREPVTKFVPAILMLNIGAWSDRTGNRKILMLVPIFGDFLASLLFLLATYYFTDWPLWVIGVIEGILGTLTGGIAVALSGVFSYLADVTDPETRTLRMGMSAAISTLGIPVGTALGGILTNAIGYYGVFALGAVLYFIGFCYTLIRIHDVKRVKEEGSFLQKLKNFIHPRNFWETFSLLFLSKGRRLLQIILIVAAYIIIMGPVHGENAQLYLYMRNRYDADIEDYSLFNTVSTLLGVAGTTIAVTVFSKMMKLHDTVLGIIATSSKVLSTALYAYAPTQLWIYVSAICDMFGNSGVTAIKSLASKIVCPDNVGKIMSIIAVLDAIIPIVAIPMYGKVYENSLSTFPGAIFVLGTILTIPDFFIFTSLYLLIKRQEKDIVENPAAKEEHAYDNDVKTDVTSF